MSSVAESLASLSVSDRETALSSISDAEARALLHDWKFWARPNQLIPEGDWLHWLLLAGRGFGKTRTGGEAVRALVESGYERIHLIGPTASDTRNVMVEGPSGLISCFPPHQRPAYEPAKHLIRFHTGAVAETFSADEPERLRGPQCQAFWADEPCAWRFLTDAWDNLQYGFRLPGRPLRGIVSSTPKPSKWLTALMNDPTTHVTRGSSYDNRGNLAPAFFQKVVLRYEGTRLGRQEIHAEVLEDTPGALWTENLIAQHRIRYSDIHWDQILRVVVAIDPAVSAGEDSAETGIAVVALTRSLHVLVLEDLTCRCSPLGWATVARSAYLRHRADRIVGEVNNGGDLVERNLHALDGSLPFRAVRASRGKARRAEPVAALYEQGRVHHVGFFSDLESQMTTYVPGDEDRGHSPDRMDALVWGITELVIDPEPVQRIVQMGEPVRIDSY